VAYISLRYCLTVKSLKDLKKSLRHQTFFRGWTIPAIKLAFVSVVDVSLLFRSRSKQFDYDARMHLRSEIRRSQRLNEITFRGNRTMPIAYIIPRLEALAQPIAIDRLLGFIKKRLVLVMTQLISFVSLGKIRG
jgi:hypothetical protein